MHDIVSYATGPLYALVHEACYGDPGSSRAGRPTGCAAEQGLPAEPARGDDGVERLPLTGENVYRSSVAADPALAPLLEAADLLAERPWDRPLYDPARLAANTVPVAACVYERDIYVDPELSRATAKVTGGVDGRRRRGPPPRRPAPGRARRPRPPGGGAARRLPEHHTVAYPRPGVASRTGG